MLLNKQKWVRKMFLDDIVGPMSIKEAKKKLSGADRFRKTISDIEAKHKPGEEHYNRLKSDPAYREQEFQKWQKEVHGDKAVSEDAWTDGQNSWSSEHDQWAREGVEEDTGSWIVYDPATKQIKKRFKTHTAGKSYAKTHGLGFASSEYYFDNVKEKAVAEDEGDCEGLPHLTTELLQHIVDQVGSEGAHAICKSLEWGDGAAEELLALILKDLKADISDEEIAEHIGKVKGGYRLYSHKGKNLGTFPSKAGAEKHEREVQYFKHAEESVEEDCWDNYKQVGMKTKNGKQVPNCVPKEGVAEAETDYSKRRQRERDIDAGKPVAKQRQPKMTDYQKRRAQQKKEMELGEMDKSQKGAAGWNIDDYPLGAKGTTAKPTTVKNVVKTATKDLDAAFNQADKKKPKAVKESYWTRLQDERNTKIANLVNELQESITK